MVTGVTQEEKQMAKNAARILWLNWSGGGNLPPSLGIARVLTERGHDVTFAGRPEMVPRVDAAGFPRDRDDPSLRAGRPLSRRVSS